MRYLICVLAVVLSASAWGQDYTRFTKKGKYGFKDASGNVVVKPKYDHALDFSEGLAAVKKKDYWFFIEANGKKAFKESFERVESFKNGMALVMAGNYYGYINKEGNLFVPLQYTQLSPYVNGVCRAYKKTEYESGWGLLDLQGNELSKFIYADLGEVGEDRVKCVRGVLEGYLNLKGEEFIPCVYDKIGPFINGWAKVYADKKFGFIDSEGNIAISVLYDYIQPFDEKGMAMAKRNGKLGYITKEGKEVVPFEFDGLYKFDKGLARAKKGEKWGYVNRKGAEVIEIKYDKIAQMREGHAGVILNRRFGFVNAQGKEVLSPSYQEIRYFDDGLIGAKRNDYYGYIDTTGKVRIPFKYDEIGRFYEGICYVRKGRKYAFYKASGKALTKLWYEDLSYAAAQHDEPYYGVDREYAFFEGLAMVRRNGKFGYIDQNGKEVIRPQYDFAYPFSEGLAKVEKNGKYGFIDSKGRLAVDFQFKDFEIQIKEIDPTQPSKPTFRNGYYDATGFFNKGYAVVSKGNKMGIIDQEGNVVVPIKYDFVNQPAENGLVLVRNNWKYGYVNLEGKEVIPPFYEEAMSFSHGLAAVNKRGVWAFIDANNETQIPWELEHVLAPFEAKTDDNGNEVVVAFVIYQGKSTYIDQSFKCVSIEPYKCR